MACTDSIILKVAENEAEECRVQAERMLAITEQLTQRNSQLAGEIAAEREKVDFL